MIVLRHPLLRASRFLLFGIVGGLAVGCTADSGAVGGDVSTEEADTASVAADIRAMLRASAAAWNGGDLEGFLDDYWRDPSLTFSGADGVTRGWEDVRERYLRSYWAPTAQRDSLRFEDLEVDLLGEDHALTLGRFVLFRPEAGDSITGSGFFSLVLKRTAEGWKIVHDHTSASGGG